MPALQRTHADRHLECVAGRGPRVCPSWRTRRMRDFELHRSAVDGAMRWVGEIDAYSMRPRTQSLHDNLLTAGVRPMPGRVVDRDVDMVDPRFHAQGSGTEHRKDTEAFRAI